MNLCAGILQAFHLLLLTKDIHGGTFSIIHPKIFRIDSDETVVINLHGYGNSNVAVDGSLTDYPRREDILSEYNERGTAGTPISFTVKVLRSAFPNVETIANKKVELAVRIRFLSGGHREINKKIIVYLTGESDYIFVQTERPIYKPGERVSIRVAPLNSQMLPMRSAQDRFEITIQTSEGVGIWKKTGNFPANDFVTADYPIPEDPPLGSYFAVAKLLGKTHTSTGSAEFKVDKYVLPTYNVEIQLDQSTVKPDGVINGKFKAEYSYGEPVVGSFAFHADLHVPGREPLRIYQKPTTFKHWPKFLDPADKGIGIYKIPINAATTKSNMTWEQLIEAKATVTVSVSVMGKAEGILESDRKEGILITNTPYDIDTSQTSKYFIPSMAHDVNIIVRDVVTKQPVPGVNVQLSIDGEPRGGRPRTDEKGAVQIPVPMPARGNSLQIAIKTDDPELENVDQAETILTLTKYASSHGYLRMTAPSHATVGSSVHVRFRTPIRSEIYYVILSKGRIISSGNKGIITGEGSKDIPITRKMSPGIRIVGYLMNGNHIISDSVSIDIDEVCISEELTVTVNPSIVKPGQRIEITYQGESRAMIGTSAVDRAAYFLNDKGRLDRKKMFEKMKSFDMGCSVTGGSNPLNVFEEAGLACTTKDSATPSKSNITCPIQESRRRKRSFTGQEVFTRQQLLLRRRCNSDGRIENLADLRCDIRILQISKMKFNDRRELELCLEQFAEGCRIGEFNRNSKELLDSTKRSSDVALIDVGSHPEQNARRTRFNEGWLWFKLLLNERGHLSHSPSPPHSITTYDIDAISVHDREGFCVAKPTELKVFKDFFIQLYLPYSVKVMEQVQIRAAIFNYHETRDRKVKLRFKGDDTLCTQDIPGQWSEVATLTVAKQSSFSYMITVIPLAVPVSGEAKIELEVSPLLIEDRGIGDHIVRQLKVEPSGSEEEFSESFQLDPAVSRANHQIHLDFPDSDVLPDSKKCWIYGYMSYLGPIIEFDPIGETPKNLDESLSLPHGCGEQNMKSVGPNVFAFNYLKYIRDPTADQRSQVQKYIIDGYTRQQSHRNNKRWAIWSHAEPTVWINAYVNKVFLHAREVWPDMDVRPICDSLRWLATQQSADGSFSEAQHSRHYWVNVAEGGKVALTAYVLITVAETGADCGGKALNLQIHEIKEKATTYLRGTVGQEANPYTAAIVAYALSLVNPRHSSTRSANQRLLNKKRTMGEEIFWQGPNRPRKHVPTWRRRKQAPIDIETTAYALLAQVTIIDSFGSDIQQATLDMINRIARWMVSQQNDRGGFQSSQTTVIAIQSMTEYAKWIYALEPPPRNPHLNLVLRATGTPWARGLNFNLDKRNEFYRKELIVPDEVVKGTRTINVAVTGEGKGSFSYRCVYRTTKNSEICDFNINATTTLIGYRADDGESEAAPGQGKNVIKLVVEVSKITDGDSGMAIIDIHLISGFIPIVDSLDALTIGERVDGVIDKFEITEQKVTIYVEKIPGRTSQPLKFGFKLQQAVTINSPSPAKITVYDYYKPEDTCSKFYAVPDGSPMIRTSCAATSPDAANQRQCKCAEGGCPVCRSREEQLSKTCADRCVGCCKNCVSSDKKQCHNLKHSVCKRNFAVIAKIISIDEESMPQFVKMRARIEEPIRLLSNDHLVKSQERTFIIRKDCFKRCHDSTMKSLEDGQYFVPGHTFLIRGREPERIVKSGGEESFDYYLDKDAMVERTPIDAKCKKIEKWRRICKNQNTDQCTNMRQKLKICDTQDQMRERVFRDGCD